MASGTGNDRVSFRLEDSIICTITELADPGLSPSEAVKAWLPHLLEMMRRDVPRFSPDEALLLADACNGWYVEPHTVTLLWAQVEDAIRDENLAEKWGIDGLALLQRLRSLTYGQAWLVCFAIQRAWRHPDHSNDMAASLRAVGLVR